MSNFNSNDISNNNENTIVSDSEDEEEIGTVSDEENTGTNCCNLEKENSNANNDNDGGGGEEEDETFVVEIDSDGDDDDDNNSYNFQTAIPSCSSDKSEINDCETITLDRRDFSLEKMFAKAVPGTWLYKKICYSTPIMASKILTENLKVKSVTCAYLDPSINDMTTFSIKKNI